MGKGLVAGRRRRVGLLGGSFNPAHRGHLHLSLTALRHLDLDEVWWLVSPQNPLKPVAGMAPFAARLRGARQVAARAPAHPRHRHRRPPRRRLALHRRHVDEPQPPVPGHPVRVADGRRQSDANAVLGALDRDISDRAHCRIRPPFLYPKGARRCRRPTFCPLPRAGYGRAAARRDKAAGLGVSPYPARFDFGNPDQGQAPDRTRATADGGQTRIGHDYRALHTLAPPPAAVPDGGAAGNPRIWC